ncbi:MAG: hypothetical protein NZ455_11405 [Bacteroidia bacterium]|nr:hypothetical protein [Bacteroidia bacterium]
MGGWGAAPLARSTPTLPTRAQQDVGKDTPKKIINTFMITLPSAQQYHFYPIATK